MLRRRHSGDGSVEAGGISEAHRSSFDFSDDDYRSSSCKTAPLTAATKGTETCTKNGIALRDRQFVEREEVIVACEKGN